MMKIKISLIVTLFCSLGINAQEFSYEVDIEPSSESGYHKVQLTPEVLGKTNGRLSDLRIYNGAGVEQPYVVEKESLRATQTAFKTYEIIERFVGKNDSSSFLTFINDSGKPIDNLSFIVQNTAVRKTAILSGSNDQQNWYTIGNDYALHSMFNSNGTTFTKRLDFPLSDFGFFKLEVKGNANESINILSIGYHENNSVKGGTSSFDFTIESQREVNDVSLIKLTLSERKYFEKLAFRLSGSKFYSRDASIYIEEVTENRKKEQVLEKRLIGSITLQSDRNNLFDFGAMRLEELFVEIENKDNQPLVVENVSGTYLNKYLVADLKAGEAYKLKFGNESLDLPNYDIAYFKRQILGETQVVKLQQIRNMKSETTEDNSEQSIFENSYLIWLIIGIIGIFVLIISIRMIKELG